jgi:hypothetical protein
VHLPHVGEAPAIPFTAWHGPGRDGDVADPDKPAAKRGGGGGAQRQSGQCSAAMRTPEVEEGGGGAWRRCRRCTRRAPSRQAGRLIESYFKRGRGTTNSVSTPTNHKD